jgi:hypothetical protein
MDGPAPNATVPPVLLRRRAVRRGANAGPMRGQSANAVVQELPRRARLRFGGSVSARGHVCLVGPHGILLRNSGRLKGLHRVADYLGLLERDEEANVGGEEMTLQSEPLKPGGSSSETPTGELGVVGARFIMAGDPSEGQFSLVEHPIVPRGLAARFTFTPARTNFPSCSCHLPTPWRQESVSSSERRSGHHSCLLPSESAPFIRILPLA